ncbi:MAG: CapA family protein, partial [Propionibacterium sp.]|nr:CapA family protein [Propionibacterium sp.]
MHGGDEYVTQPNAQQTSVAEQIVASGTVDLVYGQHVHVVQPWAMIDDTHVIYGLGNLVAQHYDDVPRGQEGLIAMVTFTQGPDGEWTVGEAEYVPTLTTKYSTGPVRLLQINKALEEGTGDKARLEAGLTRTREAVLSLDMEGITER